jgi:hypothetical protein
MTLARAIIKNNQLDLLLNRRALLQIRNGSHTSSNRRQTTKETVVRIKDGNHELLAANVILRALN